MKKLGFKVWLLIIMLIVSVLFIFAGSGISKKGVVVTSITAANNNTLYNQGLRKGMVITKIDNQQVSSLQDYTRIMSSKFQTGSKEKTIIDTKKSEYIIFTNELPNITVSNIPKTNIKLGLDLAGGARALVKAQNLTLTQSQVNDLVSITANRLNAFGLTDLKVAPVRDLSGNYYMSIEIAGATPSDLRELIGQQGKFVAKIGNSTVFVGGNKDVASVGRDAQSARVESCSASGTQETTCTFTFPITLSPAAAERQAALTANLSVNSSPQGNYLSKPLDLFLDGKKVESLSISQSLQGRVTTQISISGSGSGATQADALTAAKANMKKLQTILMTGSLPFKLDIVKLDTISPTLGKEFINSIFLAGAVALLIVSLIIFIRYRNWKWSLAMIVSMVSEIIIILGISALIRWNLDLPSIAGILATIGTGVDDLIVIMDESVHSRGISIKERLKRAFGIIMGAYTTTLVSLLPLMWAGAGLLKGFAITTIIGISVGVFITRPAFSELVRRFKSDDKIVSNE